MGSSQQTALFTDYFERERPVPIKASQILSLIKLLLNPGVSWLTVEAPGVHRLVKIHDGEGLGAADILVPYHVTAMSVSRQYIADQYHGLANKNISIC